MNLNYKISESAVLEAAAQTLALHGWESDRLLRHVTTKTFETAAGFKPATLRMDLVSDENVYWLTGWVTVLTNTNAEFRLVQVENDRVLVPDLPGYIISKRGVDVAGFYVLPPGGIETDDRTYLGYFSRLREAIQACRDHSSRQQLGELVCCKGGVAHG